MPVQRTEERFVLSSISNAQCTSEGERSVLLAALSNIRCAYSIVGSGPIDLLDAAWPALTMPLELEGMNYPFRLTDAHMEQPKSFFHKSHGKPRRRTTRTERKNLKQLCLVERVLACRPLPQGPEGLALRRRACSNRHL